MIYLLVLCSVFLLASCGSDDDSSKNAPAGNTPVQETQSPSSPYPSVGPGTGPSSAPSAGGGGSQALEEMDVNLSVVDGRGVAEFTIKAGSRALVKFDGVAGKDMHASLVGVAGDVGGYRFSQILFPDGRSDGPFQRDVAYTLSNTGRHGLRIMPDRSSGTPGGGKLRVEVILR